MNNQKNQVKLAFIDIDTHVLYNNFLSYFVNKEPHILINCHATKRKLNFVETLKQNCFPFCRIEIQMRDKVCFKLTRLRQAITYILLSNYFPDMLNIPKCEICMIFSKSFMTSYILISLFMPYLASFLLINCILFYSIQNVFVFD